MVEKNNRLIYLDSSVLIEYFRKDNKGNSFFETLSENYNSFYVSVITQYEIYTGSNSAQKPFWDNFFINIIIVPLTSPLIFTSILIERALKIKRKSIDFRDLAIAATALHNNSPFATMNEKHFLNIDGLQLIIPPPIIK